MIIIMTNSKLNKLLKSAYETGLNLGYFAKERLVLMNQPRMIREIEEIIRRSERSQGYD